MPHVYRRRVGVSFPCSARWRSREKPLFKSSVCGFSLLGNAPKHDDGERTWHDTVFSLQRARLQDGPWSRRCQRPKKGGTGDHHNQIEHVSVMNVSHPSPTYCSAYLVITGWSSCHSSSGARVCAPALRSRRWPRSPSGTSRFKGTVVLSSVVRTMEYHEHWSSNSSRFFVGKNTCTIMYYSREQGAAMSPSCHSDIVGVYFHR